MSDWKRVLSLVVAGSFVALLTSCVESRHPVSDEKTSKIDERLIGTWKSEDNTGWRVRKSATVKNALEFVTLGEDKEVWQPAFATTIKAKYYLSVTDEMEADDNKSPESGYGIYQYTFRDNDTVEVRGMEAEVLLKAIAAKQLAGEIKTEKAALWDKKRPIIIDTPENIARYLESHAEDCYPVKTDYMLTFKRQK